MKTSLITVFLSAFTLAGCAVNVDKQDGASEALAAAEARLAGMSTYDAEIAAAKAWIDIWNSADVEKLAAIAHSNYTRTAPDLNADSLDELGKFMLQVHEAYPDYSITNDAMAAGPDGVFVQWTVTGSDSGRGADSTGKPVRVTGISRYQFSEGKIANELVIFDTGSVLTQLDTSELPHAAE